MYPPTDIQLSVGGFIFVPQSIIIPQQENNITSTQ